MSEVADGSVGEGFGQAPGFFQKMLEDDLRLDRFEAAIRAAVRPGDLVIDIGAGSGILSMFAVRAGAARVHAVEANPDHFALLTRLIEVNGMTDRIIPINARSTDYRPEATFDVVVAELIGNLGMDEDIDGALWPILSEFVKPDARVVPREVRMMIAPVDLNGRGSSLWSGDFRGFDFSVLPPQPWDHVPRYLEPDPAYRLLAPAAACAVADFSVVASPPRVPKVHEFRFEIERAGRCDGLLAWFESEVGPGIALNGMPPYPGCSWNVVCYPLPPGPIAAGPLAAGTVLSGRIDRSAATQCGTMGTIAWDPIGRDRGDNRGGWGVET